MSEQEADCVIKEPNYHLGWADYICEEEDAGPYAIHALCERNLK